MTKTTVNARQTTLWLAVVVALLALVPSTVLAADSTSHSGIITGVSSNGNAGTFSITVTNPFSVSANVSVNIQINNNNGVTTTNTYVATVPPHGSQQFSVSNSSMGFGSAAAGADASTAAGADASGQAYSMINGQPCGSAHQPVCPQ
jgi:hypothetical protein